MTGPSRRIAAPDDDRANAFLSLIAGTIFLGFAIYGLSSVGEMVRWWRDDDADPGPRIAAPRRTRRRRVVDPAYGVAAGSLDLRDDREGPPRGRTGRFEHEVVGRRGDDLVVEVEDDERRARFLVRTTRRGERLVSPADSVDRHHDEAWIGAVREYLRATGSLSPTEPARE